PRNLPSAGYLIVACSAFSMRSATSLGSDLSPLYSLHRRCTSSWTRRSSLAMPCSRNEAFMSSSALALSAASSRCVMEAQPAAMAVAAARTMILVAFIGTSALDGGRVERAAVGIFREEHRERDRSRRHELQLREALLAEAVVEAPLERAHLALRDAICRPRGVGLLRVGLLREVRQVLQADAQVVCAVT